MSVPHDELCGRRILFLSTGGAPDTEAGCDLPAGHDGKHRVTHPPGRTTPLWWGKEVLP